MTPGPGSSTGNRSPSVSVRVSPPACAPCATPGARPARRGAGADGGPRRRGRGPGLRRQPGEDLRVARDRLPPARAAPRDGRDAPARPHRRAQRVDDEVHAIMVHMPLPEGIDEHDVKSRIDPAKDVEGVNPANIGNIIYGHSSIAPCTALATLQTDRLDGDRSVRQAGPGRRAEPHRGQAHRGAADDPRRDRHQRQQVVVGPARSRAHGRRARRRRRQGRARHRRVDPPRRGRHRRGREPHHQPRRVRGRSWAMSPSTRPGGWRGGSAPSRGASAR
jgi:hypothetical protein